MCIFRWREAHIKDLKAGHKAKKVYLHVLEMKETPVCAPDAHTQIDLKNFLLLFSGYL